MTTQPTATAVTGTRLINTEALDAGMWLMPQLYKSNAPNVTRAPRKTIEKISGIVYATPGSRSSNTTPGEKNKVPATT